MSNFLAIATVTAALKKTLQAALEKDVDGAMVSTVRPDGSATGVPSRGANLYLYQVTPNASLRNSDMPNRNSEGKLIQSPQVALDLHYLLTFYGEDNLLIPQRLLGSAIRTINSRPILTRQMIRNTISDQEFDFLKNSNLAEALETVKFVPASLSLEELSKLWSVFFQTPYRLSIAYIGTVVLIESEAVPQNVLPVRERNLYVFPFRQPIIEKVLSARGADMPILAEDNLVIRGKKLREDITLVKIDSRTVTPGEISDPQITITLPSDMYAGVHGLQVVHQKLMGTPPVPHNGIESNLTAFVLHPTIIDVKVSTIYKIGNSPPLTFFKLTIKPKIGKDQHVVLLFDEFTSKNPVSYTFVDKSRDAEKDTLEIPFTGVKFADYLVRVQVDGAQSQLVIDDKANSPTFNQYIGPIVKVEKP